MADTNTATVPLVYAAIAAVAGDIARDGIAKTRRNQQQGYSFRGIDDVYNALAPLLRKHNLVILPRVLNRSIVEHDARSGGKLFYVTCEIEYDFVCSTDGSRHTVKTYGEAMDSADKATNKAMSAGYKYACFQAFCIPTEGDGTDADADASTPEPISRPPAPQKPPTGTGNAPSGPATRQVKPPPARKATKTESDQLIDQMDGQDAQGGQDDPDDLTPPGDVVRGMVKKINKKSGQSKRGAWTLFGVCLDNGEWYNTFDTEFGAIAEAAGHAKKPVTITYEADGTNKKIVSLVAD